MRGKAIALCSSPRGHRITPAYAGKSAQSQVHGHVLRDHPRLCGEKDADDISNYYLKGSPPPMRGKVIFLFLQLYEFGITPAYAGKSLRRAIQEEADRDHPRLCGEKPPSACTGGRCGGSPPPMRGKDLSAGQLRRNHRITPAYAGKRSLTLRR